MPTPPTRRLLRSLAALHMPLQDAPFVPVALQDNPACARDGFALPQGPAPMRVVEP